MDEEDKCLKRIVIIVNRYNINTFSHKFQYIKTKNKY